MGCGPDSDASQPRSSSPQNKLFTSISPEASKVHFSNDINETAELNYYSYVYLYNGGGVGLGDINNDGLVDIYLTSTQGTDKLYLNKGDFEFEDISTVAGIDKSVSYTHLTLPTKA